jgi:hypothetical protein
MIKIEQLAQQALEKQARETQEHEMQEILRQKFPTLTRKDAFVLCSPIPPGRRRVVHKIARELEGTLRQMPVTELDSHLVQKFPSLDLEERHEFISAWTRVIPPPANPEMAAAQIEGMVDRALEDLAESMQEQGLPEEDMQKHLREQFPSLSYDDVLELTESIQSGRWQAVEEIVRQMAEEARSKKVGDLDDYIEDKLPYLPSRDRGEFVAQLTRPIPPRKPWKDKER